MASPHHVNECQDDHHDRDGQYQLHRDFVYGPISHCLSTVRDDGQPWGWREERRLWGAHLLTVEHEPNGAEWSVEFSRPMRHRYETHGCVTFIMPHHEPRKLIHASAPIREGGMAAF